GDAHRGPEHAGQARDVEHAPLAQVERAVAAAGLDLDERLDDAPALGISRQRAVVGGARPGGVRATRARRGGGPPAAGDRDHAPVAAPAAVRMRTWPGPAPGVTSTMTRTPPYAGS